MAKVTFDGVNKIMSCNAGVTTLDVKIDLYSDWKEWVLQGNNAVYPQALRVVGGDPLYGSVVLAPSYFLMNSWRIRPDEANHRLTVDGNLFTEEGDSPYVATLGSYNVLTNQVVTSDPKFVTGSGLTVDIDYAEIASSVTSAIAQANIPSGVWNYSITDLLTASDYVKNILGLSQNNIRIKDQVYVNNRLISSTIRLYNNNDDCISDTNYFTQYFVSGIYDGNGNLTEYYVWNEDN